MVALLRGCLCGGSELTGFRVNEAVSVALAVPEPEDCCSGRTVLLHFSQIPSFPTHFTTMSYLLDLVAFKKRANATAA